MTRGEKLSRQGKIEVDGEVYKLEEYWEVKTTGYFNGKEKIIFTSLYETLARLKMFEVMATPLKNRGKYDPHFSLEEYWVEGPKYRLKLEGAEEIEVWTH